MNKSFNFFIPVELLKGEVEVKPEDKYKNMLIHGVASTNVEDLDQEILEPSGFDLSLFKAKGLINYDHLSKKTPKAFIGEPIEAEIKDNKFIVKGKLWEKSQLARDLWDTIDIMEKSKSTRKLGWSIEGVPLRKDPTNPKRIMKSLITNIALTFLPKNGQTWAQIVKSGSSDEELDYDIPVEGDYLFKSVVNGVEYCVNKDFTIEKSKSGIYADTTENRRLGRVGQKYGKEGNKEENEEKTTSSSQLKDQRSKLVKRSGFLASKKASTFEVRRELDKNSRLIKEIDKKLESLSNVKKAFIEGLITEDIFIKAMEAGSETGQALVGKNTSGAALKAESLDDDLKILTIPLESVNWVADNWESFTKTTKKMIQKSFYDNISIRQWNVFDEFEKGKKAQIGEVRMWGGVKMKKTGDSGNAKQDWTPVTEGKKAGKEEPGQKKTGKEDEPKKATPEKLGDQAQNASESALGSAIKESPDPEVRQAAHKELERRKKEEVSDQKETFPKTEKKTKPEEKKVDKPVKKEEKKSDWKGEADKMSKEKDIKGLEKLKNQLYDLATVGRDKESLDAFSYVASLLKKEKPEEKKKEVDKPVKKDKKVYLEEELLNELESQSKEVYDEWVKIDFDRLFDEQSIEEEVNKLLENSSKVDFIVDSVRIIDKGDYNDYKFKISKKSKVEKKTKPEEKKEEKKEVDKISKDDLPGPGEEKIVILYGKKWHISNA